MEPGRALQVSEGPLRLGCLCDPTSSPDPVPLPAEWRWQCAAHKGGDSGDLSAEGGPGPGRQPRQRQAWQAEGRVHEDPGPAAGKPGHHGGGAWAPPRPPPPPHWQCCVLAISCQYSCDHLPASGPERPSLPGLPHRSLKPSSPSSLQSQRSGSGSQPDGSFLRRPLTQDQRGLSPQPLLDKTLLRLVAPGCGRGLYACLPATPLPASASFPLLSGPTCSLGSPLSSQPPS